MSPSPATDLAPRARLVSKLALDLGFALVGIAPAEPTRYADHIRRWLAAGKHGEMAYLKDQLNERLDPTVLVPGAKTIICVADVYGKDEGRTAKGERRKDMQPESSSTSVSPRPSPLAHRPQGRIARYAWGDDYHWAIKKRLHRLADALRERWPGHEYRSAVDTAPILEREHAQRAGLGWVGKHTLLIHPRLGSYLLLGEIVTTLPIQTSVEAGHTGDATLAELPVTDHCGTCTRCIDACPTHCITPYSIDASRCVSYLTLEHRGPIAPELHAPMGDWIAGCDVCQEVCPFNEERGATGEGRRAKDVESRDAVALFSSVAPRPSPLALHRSSYPLLDLLHWDAAARQKAFEKSALKRLKLDQLKRNALIAAGNALARQDDPTLRQRIEAIARDDAEPALVRFTAQQVLSRLRLSAGPAGPSAMTPA